jgi:hypothetical protein
MLRRAETDWKRCLGEPLRPGPRRSALAQGNVDHCAAAARPNPRTSEHGRRRNCPSRSEKGRVRSGAVCSGQDRALCPPRSRRHGRPSRRRGRGSNGCSPPPNPADVTAAKLDLERERKADLRRLQTGPSPTALASRSSSRGIRPREARAACLRHPSRATSRGARLDVLKAEADLAVLRAPRWARLEHRRCARKA